MSSPLEFLARVGVSSRAKGHPFPLRTERALDAQLLLRKLLFGNSLRKGLHKSKWGSDQTFS